MTAPLSKKSKRKKLNTEFMQKMHRNHTLEKSIMPYIDVNKKDLFGFTALYWAISHNNIHNLKILMDFGATLQVTSTVNALFYTISCDNLEILKYFIEKGIDKNLSKVNNTGKSYTLLEEAIKLKRMAIIEYLK